jgi:hypothetical protein
MSLILWGALGALRPGDAQPQAEGPFNGSAVLALPGAWG